MKFVVCMNHEGLGDLSADDLTLGRLYEVIEETDDRGMLRIMDDSGEDYLYPATLFSPLEVPPQIAAQLHHLLS